MTGPGGQPVGEAQRTRGRLDQILDEVGVLLAELRAEIERDRQERQGGDGGGP